MLTIEAGYLNTNGARLYYEVAGEGHPLVLIHAGVADTSMWDEQMEAFAEHYRVIRYDLRGFNKSLTEAVAYSNRQDLAALLEALDVDKAHLIGVSMGGALAVDFTLEFPDRVSALVPVAAGLSGFEHEATEAEMALLEKYEALEEAKDWERSTDMGVRVWADGPGQPEGRAEAWVRQKVKAMDLNNAASFERRHPTPECQPKPQPLTPPAAERLAEIDVPTLVMVGDLDFSDVLAAAERLAAGIPKAGKKVFPGVAHMVNMEKPEEFNRTVLTFLDSLDS